MIGREIEDRYRILAKLGEGAMGEVYLVEHLGLGRKEALKILRSTIDSPSMVSRFRREARATNRLQHPNIVAVYDFGRLPDGRFYITTEFAEGESLDAVLRVTRVPPIPRSIAILAQLADAIDHAHSRGVIHRDLKPANLMIGTGRHGDVLKVLDFGVSKIIAPDYAEALVTTGSGEVFGTPAYMAPEQIGAKGNDPRIDIYAFGCIAHEMLTGQPPFTGRTIKVLNAHMEAPPPRPSKSNASGDIPPQLDDLIFRCLSKDPARRPQTGAQILRELDRVRLGLGGARSIPSPTSRRRGARTSRTPVDATMPAFEGRWSASLASPEEETAQTEDLSGAPTGFADRGDARLAVDAVLVQLAEALIDQGCSDFELTITMANLAGARGMLDGVVARLDELAHARDAVAARAKESEQRFRFAVGELRFELEQARARGSVNPDIRYQLAQLEARMAELNAQADREIAAIEDRAISLAADRAQREEELAALLAQLEKLVEDIAPHFASSPQIDSLVRRFARVREQLDRQP